MPLMAVPGDAERYFHIRDDDAGVVSDTALVRETWAENVYQLHRSDFDHTGAMVDIGANIGVVSVYAALLGARVIAVEPQRDNLELLRRNLDLNGVTDRVQVLPVAAHRDSGSAYITAWRGNSRVVFDPQSDADPTPVLSLADLLDEAGVDECDVLKVDIEGAEYALIDGADIETLCRARYLTLEFDDTEGLDTFGAMIAKIACGFNTHIIGSPQRGGYVYARRY